MASAPIKSGPARNEYWTREKSSSSAERDQGVEERAHKPIADPPEAGGSEGREQLARGEGIAEQPGGPGEDQDVAGRIVAEGVGLAVQKPDRLGCIPVVEVGLEVEAADPVHHAQGEREQQRGETGREREAVRRPLPHAETGRRSSAAARPRTARPRWLTPSFSSGVASPKLFCSSSLKKYGS